MPQHTHARTLISKQCTTMHVTHQSLQTQWSQTPCLSRNSRMPHQRGNVGNVRNIFSFGLLGIVHLQLRILKHKQPILTPSFAQVAHSQNGPSLWNSTWNPGRLHS